MIAGAEPPLDLSDLPAVIEGLAVFFRHEAAQLLRGQMGPNALRLRAGVPVRFAVEMLRVVRQTDGELPVAFFDFSARPAPQGKQRQTEFPLLCLGVDLKPLLEEALRPLNDLIRAQIRAEFQLVQQLSIVGVLPVLPAQHPTEMGIGQMLV